MPLGTSSHLPQVMEEKVKTNYLLAFGGYFLCVASAGVTTLRPADLRKQQRVVCLELQLLSSFSGNVGRLSTCVS